MHSIAGHWIREALRAKGGRAQVPKEIWCKVPHATYCQQQLPPIVSIFKVIFPSFPQKQPLAARGVCYKWVGEVLIPVRMWSLQLKSIWKSGLATGSSCPLTALLLLPLQLLVLFPVLWVFNNSVLTPQKLLPERQSFDCQAMMWATGRWTPGQPGIAWWNRTDISIKLYHSHGNIFPFLLWAAVLSQPPSPLAEIPEASLAWQGIVLEELLLLLSVHN